MTNNGNNLTLLDDLIISILDDLTIEERFSIKQLNEKGNSELIKECRERSEDDYMDDSDAAVFILTEIWKQLRESHKIRVVK